LSDINLLVLDKYILKVQQYNFYGSIRESLNSFGIQNNTKDFLGGGNEKILSVFSPGFFQEKKGCVRFKITIILFLAD